MNMPEISTVGYGNRGTDTCVAYAADTAKGRCLRYAHPSIKLLLEMGWCNKGDLDQVGQVQTPARSGLRDVGLVCNGEFSMRNQVVPTLSPGTKIGECRIVRYIEKGGMGEVYLAHNDTLQRREAVKILRPDLRGEHKAERFLKEAQMASRIDHPNVITIYSTGEQDGVRYITMQFVDGSDLGALIRERGSPLPWQVALNIIRMACKGLRAVHDGGLIHRDIKPRNIMLSRKSSRVILMDFGLVREETHSNLTRTGDVLGTPAYMSPEQCRGETIDRRSDIYSLGATLYFLLTRSAPFREETPLKLLSKIGRGEQPPLTSLINPHVTPEVCALVRKAMAQDPKQRFVDAREMAREIKSLLPVSGGSEPDSWESFDIESILNVPSNIPEEQLVTLHPIADETPAVGDREQRPAPLRDDQSTPDLRRRIWIIGIAVSVMIAAVVIGILLSMGPPTVIEPSPPGPPAGMVRIEKGFVRLGNLETKVRTFWEQFGIEKDDIDTNVSIVSDEPQTRVEVPGFWIDKYEVTNGQYAKFLQETGRPPPEDWTSTSPPVGREDHAVRDVTYADAEAYAAWAGKKLPTREQWMRAFRGDSDRLFPWGDEYDATRALVYDNEGVPGTTLPVDATPNDVSPFGVFNLVGNVSEFIRGTYRYEGTPYRMVKGGDFGHDGFDLGVASMHRKYALDYSSKRTGFRCVIEK